MKKNYLYVSANFEVKTIVVTLLGLILKTTLETDVCTVNKYLSIQGLSVLYVFIINLIYVPLKIKTAYRIMK